jgi:hypothetical protein
MPETSENYTIFIKHISNNKIWKIDKLSAIHSELININIIENTNSDSYGRSSYNPLVVSDVSIDTIDFIITYLSKGNGTKSAPEYPIKNIHISVTLDDEYHLFADLYSDKESLKDKILKLNEYVRTAVYFKIKHLPNKLCSIIAFLLKDINVVEALNVLND